MAKRPCARSGCIELVDRGYCAAHQSQAQAKRFDRQRGTAAERGYDEDWKRFRKWFITRHPACSDCERLAEEVHHIQKVSETS